MNSIKIIEKDLKMLYFIKWYGWLLFLILLLISIPVLVYNLGSNIGNVYLLHENPEEAEGWFLFVTSRHDLPPAWIGYAKVASRQGKLETALNAYDKALESQPNHMWARLYRADLKLSIGDLDSAISDWKSIGSINVLLWLGHQAMAQKDWEAAEKFYQLVVDVAPDEWQGYYYLAAILHNQEHYDEAERLLQKGLKKSPNNSSIIFRLGRTQYFLQQYDQAVRTFSSYIELKPSDFIGWYWRGLCWEAMEATESALNDFEVAADLNPSDPNPHYQIAQIWELFGDYETALNEYKKVLEILPNHVKSLSAIKRLRSDN